MTTVSQNTRILASILALFALVVHSGGVTASLVGVAAGGALLVFGLWAFSRPAAAGGFLICVSVTSYFTDLGSMTDVQDILLAALALFVPAVALGWAALTAETERPNELRLRTRPAGAAALFALICITSVPITAVLARALAPGASFALSTMLEIAVMLVAASVMTIYVFALEPRAAEPDTVGPEID